MSDFPTQIADFLEDTATKIRSMTVDRMANAAKWTALAIIAIPLALVMVVFLCIALLRIMSRFMDVELAYAVLGGLFIVVGTFLWMLRKPREESQD